MESEHRRARERRQDSRDFWLHVLRNSLAFAGGLAVLAVGCYFMLEGYATQGASIICAVVVSFGGIFLGKSIISKEKHPGP